jgi:hypothetical protein
MMVNETAMRVSNAAVDSADIANDNDARTKRNEMTWSR